VSLLEVTGLTVRFGGLVALDGVDVVIAAGETVGVIGPNGSGKTTFFNALTGLYTPAAGEIVFAGRRLAGLEAHAIARLGIARTFQASRLCLNLSVFDNILIGMHARRRTGLVDFVVRRGRLRGEMRTSLERVSQLLARFNGDLPRRGFARVGQLPQIDRRRVEICRALAAEPKLLLLDEPSAGMSPEETAELMRDLQIVRAEIPGLSVVIIEHDMFVIEGVSRRVVAFNYGRKIAEGSFAEVAAHEDVRAAYLGAEAPRA
jgi:branched-chain amino acid transport system ATP-binding protein